MEDKGMLTETCTDCAPAAGAPVPAEDWIRAADALKREAERTKGLALAGEIMTRIASLEQSAQEAEARAKKANEEADAALSSLDAIRAEIGREQQQAATRKTEAEKRAAEAAQSAADALGDQVDAAKAAAAEIVRKANQEATDAKAAAQVEINAVVATRDALQVEAQALRTKIDDMAAELAEVNRNLAAVKEEARRRFGT